MWGPTKNLGPIGSADLTFIWYKQTNKQTNTKTDKQTDKPNLYIEVKKVKDSVQNESVLLGLIFFKYTDYVWTFISLPFKIKIIEFSVLILTSILSKTQSCSLLEE